jgi:hypothetical protein
MSYNFSSQRYAVSSYSCSTTSSDSGTRTMGKAYEATAHTDPSGTRIHTTSRNLGGPMIEETRYYDSEGNQVLEGGKTIKDSSRQVGRIESVEEIDDEDTGK